MKPDVAITMIPLNGQIRASFPFDRTEAQICAGPAELPQLTHTSRKIARILEKAELTPEGLPKPCPFDLEA